MTENKLGPVMGAEAIIVYQAFYPEVKTLENGLTYIAKEENHFKRYFEWITDRTYQSSKKRWFLRKQFLYSIFEFVKDYPGSYRLVNLHYTPKHSDEDNLPYDVPNVHDELNFPTHKLILPLELATFRSLEKAVKAMVKNYQAENKEKNFKSN